MRLNFLFAVLFTTLVYALHCKPLFARVSDPIRALKNQNLELTPLNIPSNISWAMPVNSALPITSCYGPRKLMSVFSEFHKGVDFGAPTKTPVRAVADGKIVWKGVSSCAGKTIIVAHPDVDGETILTIYRHLKSYKVKLNQNVLGGELIALSGNSGRRLTRLQTSISRGCTSGPHLHIEFKIVNEPMSLQSLSLLIKKNHGNVGDFVKQANPGNFIEEIKYRCSNGSV
jgi:murein DD-endopeptidase MepM/ murein hydrolase activator NlpD